MTRNLNITQDRLDQNMFSLLERGKMNKKVFEQIVFPFDFRNIVLFQEGGNLTKRILKRIEEAKKTIFFLN